MDLQSWWQSGAVGLHCFDGLGTLKLTAMLSRNIDTIRFRIADYLAGSVSSQARLRTRPTPDTRRIFFVVHNKNHVTIFRDIVKELSARGIECRYLTIGGHRHQPQAVAALEAGGFPRMDLSEVLRSATQGDILCVGNDWGPSRLRRAIKVLKKNGVKILGVVEGARFLLPNQYKRVDKLLCWGPSGHDIGANSVQVVGSPVIERAFRTRHADRPGPKVLVNYKFSGTVKDEGFAWGYAAIAAAREIDPDFTFSTHPSNKSVPQAVRISPEPFTRLLADATVVITRSSTVIYEALASGACVIYAPLADEPRAEFADPAGAFEIAANATELLEKARLHKANPRLDTAAAQAFLDRHVSFDPGRSAIVRIADALTNSLVGQQG